MKAGRTISLLCLAPVCLALGLQGCHKPTSMYANAPVERAEPPDGAPAAYIGRWAATATNCIAHPWTLTRDRLQAPDGTACDIVGPDATPAGYSASSMCRGPKLPKPVSSRMVLTLTGPSPGNSMSITEAPLGPSVSLVRCAA